MSENGKQSYAVLAEYKSPADIIHAAEAVRDAGYVNWDVYTPFPIHGMDGAMGLKKSRVGWFTFSGGVTGFTLGMLMIWFMNAFDYPLVVGGKPLFSPIFAFPVAYELTILLGAFGSIFGMLILNKLPMLYHPLLKNERFKGASHDKFYVVIECADPKYSEAKTRALLEKTGSAHVEIVED